VLSSAAELAPATNTRWRCETHRFHLHESTFSQTHPTGFARRRFAAAPEGAQTNGVKTVAYLKGRKPWLASDEYLMHRREAGRIYRRLRYAHDPQWRAKERARSARARRKAVLELRYGISIEEYEAVLAAQGGACAICKTTSWRPLIDQGPETGALHGLLCRKCKSRVKLLRRSRAALTSTATEGLHCDGGAAPDRAGSANA
jgi:hypothetical protein